MTSTSTFAMRRRGLERERAVAIVPTFNESGNILELVRRIREALPGAHVLVVDDASPDGTADLVRAHPAFGEAVHLLPRTGERGLGNAYRAGFAWALERGYRRVLQLDADLSHPPESLPGLVDALDEADVVIGSRYVPGGRTVGWPWRRRVISRLAGWYARAALRLPPHDPTAGFKAYRAEALRRIEVGTTTTSGYGFQVECVWRAVRRGLRVVETPIVFTDRVAGSSKMTWGVALEAAGRIAWWRLTELWRPGRFVVALACLMTVGLHLLYLDGSLMPDEGGFAMVAHWWGQGDQLYGAQWVDRPPGLVGVFWFADLLGPHGVRLVAAVVASGFVAAAAWAGWAVRGRRGAAWAALAAFFLMNTPLTQTYALNGELVAAAWTMVCLAASVHALRADTSVRPARALAAVAGMAASAALLTKQNFVDGIVFVLVLGLAHLVGDRHGRRRLLALAGAAVAGVAGPGVMALAWATTHAGVEQLAYAMYGFRIDASATMAHWSHAAPDERAEGMPGLVLGSGMATLAGAALVAGGRHFRRHPSLLLASLATGLTEVVGIVLGGNYWPHYLIGLSPVLALAAGATAVGRGRTSRLVRVVIVAPALVTLGLSPAAAAKDTGASEVDSAARWLTAASYPGDSVVVLYSHANLIDASGLRPVYPYAWSLPIRTRDPKLSLLAKDLSDPTRAPTWVVGWDGLHTWGLDADRRVEAALGKAYIQVATLCGHPVWLHRGEARPVRAPRPCG